MKNITINENNIWELYAPVFSKVTATMQKSLLLHAAINANGSVLDAGTGVGKLLPYLKANENVNTVLGIDANSFMLKESKKYEDENIKTQIGNVIAHEGNYDTIVSLNVLYTLDDPIKFLEKTYENLNKDGKFILASINKNMDMKKLTNIIDLEFNSSVNDEFKEDYNLFKECNYYLTSQTQFKPKLFNMDEMVPILEKIGYRVNHTQNDYLDTLFTIIATK